MNKQITYIIDASSLIDLEKLVPRDFFLPLFKSLENMIDSKILISHEEVFNELKGKDGDIYHWAKNHKNLFKAIDERQIVKVKEILKKFPKLIDHNKVNNADPFLISLATVKEVQQRLIQSKNIVVTEERISNSPSNPKIPNVCAEYDIECIDLNEFLKREFEMVIKLKNEVKK
jgi:hypothetical protein